MPLYEASLIFRTLTKPDCKVVLKRAAETIINEGAILRTLESLGLARPLPYAMTKDGKRYKHGSFFMCKYHAHPDLVGELKEIYERDIDVIHCYIARVVEQLEAIECTLHQELLSPAYRPEVQKMIVEDRQKRVKIIRGRNKRFNMNVDIYPFQ